MTDKIITNNQLETELLHFIAYFDINDPTEANAIGDIFQGMYDICHKYLNQIPFNVINNTWNKVVEPWDERLKDLLQKYAQFELDRRVELN